MLKPMDRDDYELDEVAGFKVYSSATNLTYWGASLKHARANRADSERVFNEHHAKNKDN